MRRITCLLFLTAFTSATFGQFPVPTDSLYAFIKYNSIWRSTANWDQIDRKFNEQLREAKTIKDSLNCFVSVLEQLNDVHSQINFNNQYFGHSPSFDDTTLAWLAPINDKAVSQTNQTDIAIFPNRIGYIRVPSVQVYTQSQINSFAQSLSDSVNSLSEQKLKGYIIDLRLNGGGNIYPMLSGLASFLGEKTIGYETDESANIVRKWEIRNGNFVMGDYKTTDISGHPNSELLSIPIVILIGPVTRSSGSMTAMAFKGRPHTLFVGEPTANGYSTSNGYFQFAPNLTLNFATHFVADRNMIIYKNHVCPDITIYHGDYFENLMEDEKIKYAIKWLSGK